MNRKEKPNLGQFIKLDLRLQKRFVMSFFSRIRCLDRDEMQVFREGLKINGSVTLDK